MPTLEAECIKCGQRFVPENQLDLEHQERSDGTPCNGEGVLLGAWLAPGEPPVEWI